MRHGWLGLALMVAGCGESDRFAPGTWQLEGWMESTAGSTRDIPGAMQSETVKLSADDASSPPGAVLFHNFYHGVSGGDIRVADGRIEGQFEQRGVDDIAAHTVPVSGTYGRDRFHLELEFTVFGAKARQIVEGKLVAPA